jgi:hypothetical protein
MVIESEGILPNEHLMRNRERGVVEKVQPVQTATVQVVSIVHIVDIIEV